MVYGQAARFHEAILKALKSPDIKICEAYFDLAAFYYRHMNTASKSPDDTHKLAGLAKKCCRETNCWCKGHENGNK